MKLTHLSLGPLIRQKKKKKNRKSFSVPLLTFLNAKLKVKLFGAVILQLE